MTTAEPTWDEPDGWDDIEPDEPDEVRPQHNDPLQEIVDVLCRWHRAAGSPSARSLAKESKRAISHTTVNEALTGRRIPTWETLRVVAHILGGDPEELQPLYDRLVMATRRTREDNPQKPRQVYVAFPVAPDCTVTIRATRQLDPAEHAALSRAVAESTAILTDHGR